MSLESMDMVKLSQAINTKEDEKCDCTSPDWWTDADEDFILDRDQVSCLKCGGV